MLFHCICIFHLAAAAVARSQHEIIKFKWPFNKIYRNVSDLLYLNDFLPFVVSHSEQRHIHINAHLKRATYNFQT